MSLPAGVVGACARGRVLNARYFGAKGSLLSAQRKLGRQAFGSPLAPKLLVAVTRGKEQLKDDRTELEGHMAECRPCADRLKL